MSTAAETAGPIDATILALDHAMDAERCCAKAALAEDGEDASFAGRYESVLGVTTVDEVVAAVARVQASGAAAHVAAVVEPE